MIYLYVALSGGGIRAALLSAGACLALEELHQKQKVVVKNLHAISGSSLWIASLVSSKADADSRCRVEAERIAKNGFARSFSYWPRHLFVLSLLFLAFYILQIAMQIGGENLYNDSETSYFFILLAGYAFMYTLAARLDSGSLDLGREPITLRRKISLFRKSRVREVKPVMPEFLSNSNVAFGVTKASELVHESMDIKSAMKIDLHTYAKASAAFPGAVGSVKIGKERYLDGGATGNVGLVPALSRASQKNEQGESNLADSLFIVDAHVQETNISIKNSLRPPQMVLIIFCYLALGYVY